MDIAETDTDASYQTRIIKENLENRQPEPEDEFLVTSGILPKLITQAKQEQELPSDDGADLLGALC